MRCSSCGVDHDDLLDFHAEAPALWFALSPAEQAKAVLASDQCEIDEHRFLRALIRIPVHDGRMLVYGVWVSLSHTNYERAAALWETPGRESEPPYFGWLCTQLPLYPPTLNLKTMVHTQPVGQRPHVELEPTEHPLAVEQQRGISPARLREIQRALLHR